MIEFARTHIIGRAAGHSSVKAAAYRSGTKQYDERNGLTADYSFRAEEVAHSEILLPEGAPEALQERNALWNAIEFAEDHSTRRATAQLAKDHIIALPRELNLYQQIELARDFARTFVAQGVGVDLNVHLHSQDNPHAHLMTTTRVIDENGIGAKARHLNGGFYGGKKVVAAEQLRHQWARFQNQWCADRGIDLLVTNNDGQWQPELHNGPKTHMAVLDDPVRQDIAADRAEAIQDNIEGLVERVARQKAVFSAHDLYRELHRHVSDPQQFAHTKAVLDDWLAQSGSDTESVSRGDRRFYTVKSTLDTELNLKHLATELFAPSPTHDRVDDRARSKVLESSFDYLSEEQVAAVEHVTGSERLSIVVGFAGTGKSTLLKAAAQCWRSQGYRVLGAALAGVAADGLSQGAGIRSRTIHSLLKRIDEGKERLIRSDVLVIDEAGMVDSELMHRVVRQVHRSGAKVVMVGDAEQLQPINAGGPLRSLSSQGGYCEISTIRRQKREADRQATAELARGNASAAWQRYLDRGQCTATETVSEAIEALVHNALEDIESGHSVAVLAHANAAVDQINDSIRAARIERGVIANEATFTSARGTLDLGAGDRVLFRRNDVGLGVKNGTLGTVTQASDGALEVQLDDGQLIEFDQDRYDEIAHGYAMTIHKSQGVTVDRSHVLLSNGWDRHLAYVAMSRHRDQLRLYVGEKQFQQHSVTETISRARIQESAVDFAERHGIDVQEAGGEIMLLDKPPEELQTRDEDKTATGLLRQGSVIEAFRHYEAQDRVISAETSDEIMDRLVNDTVSDIEAGEPVMMLAHTHQAVGQLNDRIRTERKRSGAITQEMSVAAEHRTLDIGIGDHLYFGQEDQTLGVKKGMTGVVKDIANDRLEVTLSDGKSIHFAPSDYRSLSYGYAMTIHQSTSTEIDRARVLISNTFNRQVSLTGMTQHKKELTMYYAKEQFRKRSPVEIMARERSGSEPYKRSIQRSINRSRGR